MRLSAKRPLWFAVDEQDHPLAFMLLDQGHMEALFVDPAFRHRGLGAALVRHGLTLHPEMSTDVNEQNAQAVGFTNAWASSARAALRSTGKAAPTPSSI